MLALASMLVWSSLMFSGRAAPTVLSFVAEATHRVATSPLPFETLPCTMVALVDADEADEEESSEQREPVPPCTPLAMVVLPGAASFQVEHVDGETSTSLEFLAMLGAHPVRGPPAHSARAC